MTSEYKSILIRDIEEDKNAIDSMLKRGLSNKDAHSLRTLQAISQQMTKSITKLLAIVENEEYYDQ